MRTTRIVVLVFVTAALGVGGLALAEEHTVVAFGLEFTPENLTIAVGDTVTWVNDGGFHNVNAPGFFRCANGCDGEGGDGDIASNPWTFSRTFDDPASIDYFCDQHIPFGMVGNVTVVAGGAPSLAVTGDCPGEIVVTITGAGESAAVGIAIADAEGSAVIPSGQCAGTEIGLDSPSLLGVLPANPDGRLRIERSVQLGLCGKFMQAVDLSTCGATSVEQLP